MPPACLERSVKRNRAQRQVRNGKTANARRNLALVLGADRTVGCEHNGAGRSRLTSANVTAGGEAYEMPGSTGGEPARAVGACATGKTAGLGAR